MVRYFQARCCWDNGLKVFSSAISRNKNWREAIAEVSSHVKKDLDGKSCDLLIAFLSEAYEDFEPSGFANVLSHFIPSGTIIGCNSGGIISNSKEVEMEPAISVLAMHLPDVKIFPFQLNESDMTDIQAGPDLINTLDIYPPDKPHFIVFADPTNFDVIKYLHLSNEGYKGLPVIGGLSSGAVMGAPNWLFLNGVLFQEGLVGVALTGDIEFDVIVSQGCRPVGKPYVITKAEGNVLYELAGRSSLEVVRELIQELSPKDRKLAELSTQQQLILKALEEIKAELQIVKVRISSH